MQTHRSGNESQATRMPVLRFLKNLPRINRNWSPPPHALACRANSANLNLPQTRLCGHIDGHQLSGGTYVFSHAFTPRLQGNLYCSLQRISSNMMIMGVSPPEPRAFLWRDRRA